jgi:adenine deaminase
LEQLRKKANNLGVNREDPFMTLSFMALTVIPSLKLTDRGLFDVEQFKIVKLILD